MAVAVVKMSKEHQPYGVDLEASGAIAENAKWHSHCGKQAGVLQRKLKIGLPYDPAISFLGMYPEVLKSGSWKKTFILLCSPQEDPQ